LVPCCRILMSPSSSLVVIPVLTSRAKYSSRKQQVTRALKPIQLNITTTSFNGALELPTSNDESPYGYASTSSSLKPHL
jgi:hypothetical protein